MYCGCCYRTPDNIFTGQLISLYFSTLDSAKEKVFNYECLQHAQTSLICGVIDDRSRSFKAIDERVFTNFRDKNAVFANFRANNTVFTNFRAKTPYLQTLELKTSKLHICWLTCSEKKTCCI